MDAKFIATGVGVLAAAFLAASIPDKKPSDSRREDFIQPRVAVPACLPTSTHCERSVGALAPATPVTERFNPNKPTYRAKERFNPNKPTSFGAQLEGFRKGIPEYRGDESFQLEKIKAEGFNPNKPTYRAKEGFRKDIPEYRGDESFQLEKIKAEGFNPNKPTSFGAQLEGYGGKRLSKVLPDVERFDNMVVGAPSKSSSGSRKMMMDGLDLPAGVGDMYNGSMDDSQQVIADRLMVVNRKSNLRAAGDPIRGDLAIVPNRTGWFQVAVRPTIDLQGGALNVIAGVANANGQAVSDMIVRDSGNATSSVAGVTVNPNNLQPTSFAPQTPL